MDFENDSPPPPPFSLISLPEAWGEQKVSWHHYAPLLGMLVLLVFGAQVWAQGLFVLGAGIFLWRKPPRYALSRQVDVFAAGVSALMLLTFLPYFIYRVIPLKWLNQGGWRARTSNLDIDVSALYTPQPLLTLEALGLLLAALAAIALLAHAPLYPAQRWRYALFVTPCLAALGVLGALGGSNPFTEADTTMVPALSWARFPNFGTAMAVGSLLAFALLISALRNRWVYGIALTSASLVGCAVGLAFSGTGLWSWTALVIGLWSVIMLFRTRKISGLIKAMAALVLLTATALVVFAHVESHVWLLNQESLAERNVRYYDAATLVMQQSAMGIGAGNFEYVFPFYQKRSLAQGAISNPGNDWLWLAGESGLVGLSAMALLACALLMTTFGKSGRRSTPIRLAAICALILFGFGSMAETPGHYLGTVMLAILCLQIGRVRGDQRRRSFYPRWLWKAQGALLVLLGLLWLGASLLNRPWQSAIAADVSHTQLQQAILEDDVQAADAAAQITLRFTPLAWQPYQARGRAAIVIDRDLATGKADLDKALALVPNLAEIAYQQGLIWLPYSTQEAERSFRTAIERGGNNPGLLYANIVRAATHDANFQTALARLSQINNRMRFAYLMGVLPAQFNTALTAELRADAELKRFSEPERRQIIERWIREGNTRNAIRYLQEYPDAVAEPWYLRGVALARLGDYKQATDLFSTSLPMAQIPNLLRHTGSSNGASMLPGLELSSPVKTHGESPYTDLHHGQDKDRINHLNAANLLQQQLEAQQWDKAQQTATRLLNEPEAPAYAFYWSAWLHHRNGEFAAAWPLWENYARYYLEWRWEKLAEQRRSDSRFDSSLTTQAFDPWGFIENNKR